MNEILRKIEASFRASLKGQESQSTLIRWWGIPSYFIFYFVIKTLIFKIDIRFVDLMLSSIAMIYFLWHIFALIKCSPKKPKLTKEEQKILREERRRNLPRSFMRKLFLQEPISKWNPVAMSIAADLLFFATFLGYVLN